MTLQEIRKRKDELKNKIEEVRTEGDLEDIREQIAELQAKEQELLKKQEEKEAEDEEEKPDEENTDDDEEIINEKSLIKNQKKKPEERKTSEMKIIKKVEDEKMEEKNILETKEYRRAFLKKLQGKRLTDEEQRAMTTANNSVGSAIPTTILNRIEEKLRQTSALFNEVEILNIPRILINSERKCYE